MAKATRESPGATDAADIYVDGTYLEHNATWHVEDSPWKARQIQTILSKNHIQPKTVCEIGCGAGEILRQLSLKMPDANFCGYELSPQAFELCKSRASENIEFHLKDVLEEDVVFDVLLCIDVFEHVSDYIGFIKALKPKAVYKVFHIPLDISVLSVIRGTMMRERASVGHLHYFTQATALATLRDCGYELVDYFYTTPFNDWPGATVEENLGKILRKCLYAISPDLMVTLAGGCTLMVLSK